MNYNPENYEPKWLLLWKSMIRPMITTVTLGLIVYIVITKFKLDPIDKENLWFVIKVIVIYWFTERMIKTTGAADLIANLGLLLKNKGKNNGNTTEETQ